MAGAVERFPRMHQDGEVVVGIILGRHRRPQGERAFRRGGEAFRADREGGSPCGFSEGAGNQVDVHPDRDRFMQGDEFHPVDGGAGGQGQLHPQEGAQVGEGEGRPAGRIGLGGRGQIIAGHDRHEVVVGGRGLPGEGNRDGRRFRGGKGVRIEGMVEAAGRQVEALAVEDGDGVPGPRGQAEAGEPARLGIDAHRVGVLPREGQARVRDVHDGPHVRFVGKGDGQDGHTGLTGLQTGFFRDGGGIGLQFRAGGEAGGDGQQQEE